MGNVRIYDLAKEFGLKSKELADKLIAMGYPILSHSSSVDDEMAVEIRKKMQGEAVSASAEGRIELRNRPESSAAKGKIVVRRRSKADKEEAARKQEEAEVQALEAQLQEEARVEEEAQQTEGPLAEPVGEAVAEAADAPAKGI